MLITDCNTYYDKYKGEKILIGNGYLVKSNHLSQEEIFGINAKLNGCEIEAGEQMIRELRDLCEINPELKVIPDKYLSDRNQFDIRYSYLYQDFKIYVLKRNILNRILELLLSGAHLGKNQLELYLNDEYRLISCKGGAEKILQNSRTRFYSDRHSFAGWAKNIYYFFHSLLNRSVLVRTPKFHIALYIFDIPSEADIFQTFIQLIKSRPDIELSIVQISSGISPDKTATLSGYQGGNVHFFEFRDFKAPYLAPQSSFFKWLTAVCAGYVNVFRKSIYRKSLSVYYSFTEKSLKRIRPDLVLYPNTVEFGRAVSDTCRLYKIPVINVEYSLFTDDPIHMESNILFSARACIGESGIAVWKKRHDPTPVHEAIGFIKLDKLKSEIKGKEILTSFGLNADNKTVFFASTWGGTNDLYNFEKIKIVEALMDICARHGYNFIIKKHPAEVDDNLENILKMAPYKNVKIFGHHEIDLHQVLFIADLLVTQNSSVSAEALYHYKPTIFINLTDNLIWPDLFPFIKENFVFNTRNIHDLEKNIIFIMENPGKMAEEIRAKRDKYLYQPDGNASARLLDLCFRMKKNYGS